MCGMGYYICKFKLVYIINSNLTLNFILLINCKGNKRVLTIIIWFFIGMITDFGGQYGWILEITNTVISWHKINGRPFDRGKLGLLCVITAIAQQFYLNKFASIDWYEFDAFPRLTYGALV